MLHLTVGCKNNLITALIIFHYWFWTPLSFILVYGDQLIVDSHVLSIFSSPIFVTWQVIIQVLLLLLILSDNASRLAKYGRFCHLWRRGCIGTSSAILNVARRLIVIHCRVGEPPLLAGSCLLIMPSSLLWRCDIPQSWNVLSQFWTLSWSSVTIVWGHVLSGK